ncbi:MULTISPECIES: trypsin-like serine protease [Vibrio]|uniref:Trypsin-like serine protease n=1 Tax=Vibrio tasmaniensis TaxID=212663 RepID=A0A2N7NCU3_9VIBR|nr:trypsin-like serine protease [Vibrio tasmaniensis]PMO89816.1 hypothetical protein BCT01_00610 [Vibrio tasmaniensis]PMP10011.1 hypothetical protein BCS92_02480 [Vibrio tasmaniensis]TKG32642.1 trypsin-like serine protease [Vibrio tasmaniensis]TKG41712.1 trypsin-like serine protease [Vibrio tasmaniensis]TKG52067.1 trypsin-like serine protease [Vibrio tasmaniensis]
MKRLQASFLAISVLASLPAVAVVNGTNVSSSTYQDYVLKVDFNGSNCGGALIGSEYFLTAKHCLVGGIGSTGIMKYGQSIKNETTASVGYTIVKTGEDSGLAADWVANTDARFATLLAADSGLTGYSLKDSKVNKDWALLKLDSKIGHSTGAILSPLYDFGTKTNNLPLDTKMTFRGFGIDSSGSAPSIMQTSQFKTNNSWHQARTEGKGFGDVYDAEVGVDIPIVCLATTYNGTTGDICYWDGYDTVELWNVGTTELGAGDSGTPLSHDNKILAIASSSAWSNKDVFQHFTYSMDHIASAINKVIYPNAHKQVTSGDSSTQAFTVAIQNFSGSSVNLAPTLVDPTGQFSAVVAGCVGILDAKQGCLMTASFDPKGVGITSTFTASIDMGNGESVPLKISVKPTTKSTPAAAPSGGSGGSMGLFSMLALMSFGWLRRKA